MRLEEDELFDLVSDAIIWHLAAPDVIRGKGTAQHRHTLAAATSVLYQTVSRMLAVTTAHRFPTFLTIALLLACESVENCKIFCSNHAKIRRQNYKKLMWNIKFNSQCHVPNIK